MKNYLTILPFLLALTACDLSQRITDRTNNISDFIASRYPALLADPGTEIYEYASVLDYGNTGGIEMYGTPKAMTEYGDIRDYTVYVTPADYALPIKQQMISEVAKDYGTLSVLEKKSFILNTKEVKVEKGDTAYSISKKYNMPLPRFAILNDLKEPYSLGIGQTVRVETAEIVTTKTEITKTDMTAAPTAPTIGTAPVIRSNSAVRLPTLDARAGSFFAWPIRGNIISDFGPKKNGLTNDGINIAAPQGTDVQAAENGVVAYAGNELKGMGNLLIIQHSGGWMTVYAHLDSFIVRRGDKVRIGQKVGTVGKTGKVDESQLHFEIRKGSKAYDPKKQLK